MQIFIGLKIRGAEPRVYACSEGDDHSIGPLSFGVIGGKAWFEHGPIEVTLCLNPGTEPVMPDGTRICAFPNQDGCQRWLSDACGDERHRSGQADLWTRDAEPCRSAEDRMLAMYA